MSSPKPERARRWLASAVLLGVAPKCVLCAIAYTGLGAAIGLGGPELCGGIERPATAETAWLLGLGACAAFVAVTGLKAIATSARRNAAQPCGRPR